MYKYLWGLNTPTHTHTPPPPTPKSKHIAISGLGDELHLALPEEQMVTEGWV